MAAAYLPVPEVSYRCGQLPGMGVLCDYFRAADDALWSGGDEGPWMMSMEDTARDTLAAIVPGARTSELSAQWGRIQELASPGLLPPEQLVPVIEEIAGLARRARDTGEHLYCWCCL